MKSLKHFILVVFISFVFTQSPINQLKEKVLEDLKKKKKPLTSDYSKLISNIDYNIPIFSGSVDEVDIDSRCKEISLSLKECNNLKMSKMVKNNLCSDLQSYSVKGLLLKGENSFYCIKNENGKIYYYFVKALSYGNLIQQYIKIVKRKCHTVLFTKKCSDYIENVKRGLTVPETKIIENTLEIKVIEEIIKKLEN